MATPLIEGGAEFRRQVILLPELYQQIVSDVAVGVQAIPGIDQAGLMKDFVKVAAQDIDKERRQFCPPTGEDTGQYYKVMQALQGENFTKRPFRERFEIIAQTGSLTKQQQDELVSQGLARLYGAYLKADPKDRTASQNAWQDFVEAHRHLLAYTSGDRFRGSFPSFWCRQNVYIDLPALVDYVSTRDRDPEKALVLANTELQVQIARTTGILASGQTWQDFIHRDNIKKVDFYYKKQPEDEGLILGELSVNWDFSLGGFPASYSGVTTKYPKAEASVFFNTKYDHSADYRRNLADLIAEGCLSPRLLIKVPTPVALSITK